MDYVRLIALGFSKNEAQIYLHLTKKRHGTAAELIKDLDMHRSIIYDNLEKLLDKGIISYIYESGTRIYQALDPSSIETYFAEEVEKAEKKVIAASTIVEELEQIKGNKSTESKVEFFRGKQGIRKVFEQTLQTKDKKLYFIGLSNESVEVMGETYANNFNQKIRDNNIKEYILFNDDYKDITILTANPLDERKTLPAGLSQRNEILLFDNKVAILVFAKTPSCILIEDDHIYQTHKAQFDFLWKHAKEIDFKK